MDKKESFVDGMQGTEYALSANASNNLFIILHKQTLRKKECILPVFERKSNQRACFAFISDIIVARYHRKKPGFLFVCVRMIFYIFSAFVYYFSLSSSFFHVQQEKHENKKRKERNQERKR